MKISRRKALIAVLGIGSGLMVRSALGQSTADPQGMLQVFADASVNWQSAIFPFALGLFKLLAAVDFAWTCVAVALEKSDAQALVATIIKKLMVIGIFYALLIFAPQWFPLIIQSFVQIGGSASGTATPLNPSDIFKMGATIAGTLLDAAANTTSLLTSFSTSLALIFAAAVIVISYVAIAVHFVMAMVESYLLVGAGYIFLGFGGSRWTSSYAEKYVSQVISVGSRLMVLYLVIGLGQQFATQWIAAAHVAANGASANLSLSWTLAAQVAMYAVICWTVPKLVSNVIGGTLSASAGDAIGMGVAAATAALSAVGLISGVGAPAAAAGGSSAVSGVATAANAGSGAARLGTATQSGGAGGLGSASFAPGSANGGTGATMATGDVTPPPPSNGGGTSSRPSTVDTTGARPVATPPPPEHHSGSKAQAGLNKARDFIRSVHGSLPPDGAVVSGPSLNIGHPTE
jgi:type IV secretion system protein TrbL